MAKPRIYWVDAGMAAMASAFIVIVIFLRGESYFMTVLLSYLAALIVWAFVAESAVVSAERKHRAPMSDPGRERVTHINLVPH